MNLPAKIAPQGGEDVEVTVVRSLGPDDLALMAVEAPARAPVVPGLVSPEFRIRASHHQLARLLASGASNVEAGLITGYDPGYVARLRKRPEFEELLEYYGSQEEIRWSDVKDRLTSLGISSLDELQHRLETDPQSWTRRELMELAELTLVKPAAARSGFGAGSPSGAPGVQVHVSFVQAAPQELKPVIDQEIQR